VFLIEPKGTEETEMTLEVIVVPVADVGGEGLLCQTTASAKHGKLRPSASRARIPMKASA
jgi:hypothetical protein